MVVLLLGLVLCCRSHGSTCCTYLAVEAAGLKVCRTGDVSVGTSKGRYAIGELFSCTVNGEELTLHVSPICVHIDLHA